MLNVVNDDIIFLIDKLLFIDCQCFFLLSKIFHIFFKFRIFHVVQENLFRRFQYLWFVFLLTNNQQIYETVFHSFNIIENEMMFDFIWKIDCEKNVLFFCFNNYFFIFLIEIFCFLKIFFFVTKTTLLVSTLLLSCETFWFSKIVKKQIKSFLICYKKTSVLFFFIFILEL